MIIMIIKISDTNMFVKIIIIWSKCGVGQQVDIDGEADPRNGQGGLGIWFALRFIGFCLQVLRFPLFCACLSL